jgi:DNA-binding transcriptional LysR family regulator
MTEPTGKQLAAFFQVNKQGSIGKAAEVLRTSKSAVKCRLHRLKNNPNFKIPETKPNPGPANTPAGHKLRYNKNLDDHQFKERF